LRPRRTSGSISFWYPKRRPRIIGSSLREARGFLDSPAAAEGLAEMGETVRMPFVPTSAVEAARTVKMVGQVVTAVLGVLAVTGAISRLK
jgi:hypothetical protein